jgi:hypothetical protein
VGDNLDAETAPFSFKLKAGEELRGAAHAYTPSLTEKITQLLLEYERLHFLNSSCNASNS